MPETTFLTHDCIIYRHFLSDLNHGIFMLNRVDGIQDVFPGRPRFS